MIVLTNGQIALMTFQDTEWNDNAKYADHINNGITHGFRCHPKYAGSILGDIETDADNWTHDQVAAVAVEEVSISNEYT